MNGSITILCGVAGSGKSTWVGENGQNYVVLCPDEFRKILTGQDFYKPAEEAVWSSVKTAARVLAGPQNRDILIDATSVTVGQRSQWICMAKELDIPVHCVMIDTPVDVCKERNLGRARRVPEKVIDKQAELLERPTEQEGFVSVRIVNGNNNGRSPRS